MAVDWPESYCSPLLRFNCFANAYTCMSVASSVTDPPSPPKTRFIAISPNKVLAGFYLTNHYEDALTPNKNAAHAIQVIPWTYLSEHGPELGPAHAVHPLFYSPREPPVVRRQVRNLVPWQLVAIHAYARTPLHHLPHYAGAKCTLELRPHSACLPYRHVSSFARSLCKTY